MSTAAVDPAETSVALFEPARPPSHKNALARPPRPPKLRPCLRRDAESPAGALAWDRRTRAGQAMERLRADLVRQLGGEPVGAQKVLMERVLQAGIRLFGYDERFAMVGAQSERDGRIYGAWHGMFIRAVTALMKAPAIPVKEPTFNELVDEIARSVHDRRAAVAPAPSVAPPAIDLPSVAYVPPTGDPAPSEAAS